MTNYERYEGLCLFGLLIMALCIGALFGWTAGAKSVRHEAVRQGAAYYTPSEDGTAVFTWKTPTETPPK